MKYTSDKGNLKHSIVKILQERVSRLIYNTMYQVLRHYLFLVDFYIAKILSDLSILLML